MSDEKELIRRALMGEKQAQEECTAEGIVLPCPFCGGRNIITSNWGMFRCWCPDCHSKSEDCLNAVDAIKSWNTRPAPPIGRCGECKNWNEGDCYRQELTKADDYCSYFEPREE